MREVLFLLAGFIFGISLEMFLIQLPHDVGDQSTSTRKNQQVSKRPSGGSKTMVRIRPSSTTAMDILHKTSSASAASKLAVLRPSTATTMDIHKFLRDLFHGSKGRLVDLGAGELEEGGRKYLISLMCFSSWSFVNNNATLTF